MHAVPLALLLAVCSACSDGEHSDDSDDSPPPQDDPLVQASGEIACANPNAREAEGPQERTLLGDGAWTFAADWRQPGWDLRWGGRGIVVADFDGDGLLDIVAPQTMEPTRLLLGTPGGDWVDRPLPDVEGVEGAVGGSAADIDGDGDMDLFLYGLMRDLTGSPDAGVPPVLLVNDGTATFTGTSHPEWEDADLMGCGGSGSWADFDLDGDLDLFYGRLGLVRDGAYISCPKRLLENQGDGSFVDVADQHFDTDLQQLRVLASGWHPAWDGDRWPELYVVADAILEGSDPELAPPDMSDVLYDNGPNGLERKPNLSLDIKLAGMGLAAEDLNGDGLVDIMVPGVAELPLLVSIGDEVWSDQSDAWGSAPDASRGQSSGWGGEFADLDNDGLLDMVLTFGSFASWEPEPDEIFRRTGPTSFEAVGEAWGFADGEPNRGVLVVDLDANGWLDIVKREIGGIVFVDVANCGDAAWMEVVLDGTGLNRFGVGATIHLTVGGTRYTRTITAGSTSFASGGPPMAHFGLADADQVDAIEVVWPDGDTVTTHGPQTTRQILTISHPDR